jgi:hypothetical protein
MPNSELRRQKSKIRVQNYLRERGRSLRLAQPA